MRQATGSSYLWRLIINKRILSAVAVLTFLSVSQGQAQEPFCQGKTITILAGTGAGNVYDIVARLFARHLGKHIPGNPDIIVQNMPGAASMIAANRGAFGAVQGSAFKVQA
jgi:tripartite-type tricarboxylate transporter receptor subunit TctC